MPLDGGTDRCEVCRLRAPSDGLRPCGKMVAESHAMRLLLMRARRIAESDSPVVIFGETGTGKEVLARALHATSRRADRPFLAVNCSAIPGELLESELFGHARGSFTGAISDRRGLFEAADHGTLLLDEVAELPLPLQVKLLRVLQSGEVRRVGENQPVWVDVRIIAATHRDLSAAVELGLFRQDLFYRLKVFLLRIPPLRERPEDILPLARQFLATQRGPARRFSAAAERALAAWRWPGNCRELVNCALHAAALADGEEVTPADLPEELCGMPEQDPAAPTPAPLITLAAVERAHVLGVLAACAGRQADAARVLGIGRSTLWRKLEAWRQEGSTTTPCSAARPRCR